MRAAIHQLGEYLGACGERVCSGPAHVPVDEHLRRLRKVSVVVAEGAEYLLLVADQGAGVKPGRLIRKSEPHRDATRALVPN